MPNRMTAALTHCLPFLRAHPQKMPAPHEMSVGALGRTRPQDELSAPAVFYQRLEEALQGMESWPDQGAEMARLRADALALIRAEPHAARISPHRAADLARWLGEVGRMSRAWSQLSCLTGGHVDQLEALEGPEDDLGTDALVEQLALARQAEGAARQAFSEGRWRDAQAADEQARLHCEVGQRIDACMRSGTDAERALMGDVLDQCRRSGDFAAARAFRLEAERRYAGLERVLSAGQDSLLSPEAFETARRRIDAMDGKTFRREVDQLIKLEPRWPSGGLLQERLARSVEMLRAHGPKGSERPTPAHQEQLAGVHRLAVVAARACGLVESVQARHGGLKAAFSSAPAHVAQGFGGREVRIRSDIHRAITALMSGQLDSAEELLNSGKSLADATTHLLGEASVGRWNGAAWQAEQFHYYNQQAERGRGVSLSTLQKQALACFDEAQRRFELAPDERAASRALYDMERAVTRLGATGVAPARVSAALSGGR